MSVLDSFLLSRPVSTVFIVPTAPLASLEAIGSYEPTADDIASLYGPGVLGDTDWLTDEEKVIEFEGMTELQYGNEYLDPENS